MNRLPEGIATFSPTAPSPGRGSYGRKLRSTVRLKSAAAAFDVTEPAIAAASEKKNPANAGDTPFISSLWPGR